VPVRIGALTVGGHAPILIQSMTNTDTADVESTVQQVTELARAGSEVVRITVNHESAAKAVPAIREALDAQGCMCHWSVTSISTATACSRTIRSAPRRLRNTGSIPAMSVAARRETASSQPWSRSPAAMTDQCASA
jgi:hypothetical protein